MTDTATEQQSTPQQVDGEEKEETYKPLIPIKRDPVWDQWREAIAEAIPEMSNLGSPDLIRGVYMAGIRDYEVLKSLAALSLPTSVEAQTNYDFHILTLAKCLARPSPIPLRKSAKLACLRTLMTLRTPLEAGWQLQETVIQDTLRFITDRTSEWEYLDHSDEVLLWELRAICLMEMEMIRDSINQQLEQGGNAASSFISKQAVMVERGLVLSAVVINAGIEGAGEKVKTLITPATPLLESDRRAQVLSLTYSDAAKRATDNVREGSREAMVRIKSASASGVQTIATQLNDRGVGEKLIPDERNRKVITAVGKIGIATVGAAALVADTLIESTGQIAKTTATVTADLIEHKYGPSAGQLVRNSNDTVGNIFRTVGHVSLLHKSRSMTKSVAKHAGKMQIFHLNQRSLMDESEDSSSLGDESGRFLEAEGPEAEGPIFQNDMALSKEEEEEEEEKNDDDDDEIEQHNEERLQYQSTSSNNDESQSEKYLSDSSLNGDVFVVEESEMGEFNTEMKMTLSELDGLPDQITSVDAQSDIFSDISCDRTLVYYADILNRNESSRNSIFRNLQEPSQQTTVLALDRMEKMVGSNVKRCFLDEDDSLDYTACTVEESFFTNSTFVHDDLSHPYFDIDGECHVSNGIVPITQGPTPPSVSMSLYDTKTSQKGNVYESNRVPPNEYAPIDEEAVTREAWRRGLYSTVKSRFGLG